MLSGTRKRNLRYVALLVLMVAASPFLIRAIRFYDNIRICSEIGSYQLNFIEERVIFDDYILADQQFPMSKCSIKIDLRNCFVSNIVFVNPFVVKSGDVEFEFTSKVMNGIRTAYISRIVPNGKFQNMRWEFESGGDLKKMTTQEGGMISNYYRCQFPLFR